MTPITLFLHLTGLVLANTQIFGYRVVLRNSNCSKNKLDLDFYGSINLEYHGSEVLLSNPCFVEFTKSSYKKYICVYTEEIRLDCDTTLEYHRGFIKKHIDPEKRLKCEDRPEKGDEWCANEYKDKIFVVIKKPPSETSDEIKLRIYQKDVPELFETSSSKPAFALLALIVPCAAILTVVILVCYRIRLRQLQAARRPQISYQTTQGTVNMQTGYQPAPFSNFQGQHSAAPLVLGDYHVHPMQSAYPVTSLQSPAPATSAPAQEATPQTSAFAPPPSYESVVQGKTYEN